jgi:hypothetical protein
LKNASNTLKANRKIVLAAVTGCGLALEYVDDKFMLEREIVLAAVESDYSDLFNEFPVLKIVEEQFSRII